MLKFVRWLLGIVVAIVVIAFAVANTHDMNIGLPFAGAQYAVPVFAAVLVAALIGFVAGGVAAWLGAHRWRRLARRRGQEIDALEGELTGMQERLTRRLGAPPPDPD